ncbi:uncharacterized protein BHQ10_003082 [Talaromyces amestolkiae]|uniref:Uncharacterized protein n=1 Tax=Talaromyces amestolkiae TaxID=1196081 RepID=A0A364KU39_TALAM|nr:uncharacterized protein BHQ10_003082 [Talaromyces amestolkiae]RAO67070.1 hypothetical protein BHQ10_003082 [Talaromyces amestolkiae]
MPQILTLGEQFEQRFHDNAPDRFGDIYMKFEVHFEDTGHEYTVMIGLYDCDTDDQLRWVEPAPQIRVKHYADRLIQTEFNVKLEIDNDKYLAVFDGDLDDRGWSECLLIVMEFEGDTVKYEFDSHELFVEETRVVTLLSHKTFTSGAQQIWGKDYIGCGKSLAIKDGHSLES